MDIIVRTAVESVRRKTPSARFSFSPDVPARISCHPEEMADAVSYVLENALESQDGYAEPIAIRTVSADSGIAVEIEDAGSGIADSDWRNVSNPFFTTKAGHLGLGLYFARLITERNGGSLEIAPRASGGTRVRFVFAGTGAVEGKRGGGGGDRQD
jgi:signal transduction histidine kinase